MFDVCCLNIAILLLYILSLTGIYKFPSTSIRLLFFRTFRWVIGVQGSSPSFFIKGEAGLLPLTYRPRLPIVSLNSWSLVGPLWRPCPGQSCQPAASWPSWPHRSPPRCWLPLGKLALIPPDSEPNACHLHMARSPLSSLGEKKKSSPFCFKFPFLAFILRLEREPFQNCKR